MGQCQCLFIKMRVAIKQQIEVERARRVSKAAFAAVAGITCATLVWALLAVLGVGVIFAAHPSIRFALQCVGGVYLGWVGLKLWRSTATESSPRSTNEP